MNLATASYGIAAESRVTHCINTAMMVIPGPGVARRREALDLERERRGLRCPAAALRRKQLMKALGAAIAASVILPAGSVMVPEASAQSVRIGPSGVRIDTDRDRWDRRGRWDRWDRRDWGRTVIERKRRRGRIIETRRRVCR